MKRPWGWMLVLFRSKHWWVKLIRVRKGHRTSLQYHLYRHEWHWQIPHWGIRYVDVEEIHRMTEGWYIEIAHGTPEEADIVRLQDDYNRSN